MSITIRQVQGQESLDILYQLDNYAFRPTPPFPDRDEWEERMKSRKGPLYYALFENGEAVSIVACPIFTQNLRGKIIPMAGFADVSSHPKARNKGYVRQTMRYAMREIQQKGYALSCLYPFRESFYERLGWVTFPQSRKMIFSPADLRPLLKRELDGEVEIVLIGDGYDEYFTYTQEMQTDVHGMAVFADSQKESAQSNREWLALARVDGELVGLMTYSLKGEEIMKFNFRAPRFYYQDVRARYLLLQWIARHIDQAERAELWLPAYERANTWLSDMRPKMENIFVDPMGRVIDVAGLNGIQAGDGEFWIEINDPDCPWNEGIWHWQGRGGTLKVSPSPEANAQCALTIQSISALVYGTNDPADFAIRGWGESSSSLQSVMRNMFPIHLPYLHEYF